MVSAKQRTHEILKLVFKCSLQPVCVARTGHDKLPHDSAFSLRPRSMSRCEGGSSARPGSPTLSAASDDLDQRGSRMRLSVTEKADSRRNSRNLEAASFSEAVHRELSRNPSISRSESGTGSQTFMRHLELYNEAARHYAWKKQALRRQKYNFRLRLQLILEEPSTSRLALAVAYCSAAMIFAQVVLIMLETGAWGAKGSDEAEERYKVADYVMSITFTVELVLRTYAATGSGWRDVLRSFFWWVDVIGVVPFYFELLLNLITDGSMADGALGQVRDLLRLLRILRVLKVIRHHPDSAILFKALKESARPLVVPLTFLIIGVTFFGSFVFYFEQLVRR